MTQTRSANGVGRGIEIRIGERVFPAVLNDSVTAGQVFDALPLCGDGHRWGDEIYFDVGADFDAGDQREEVKIGDIAYWRPGRALCLFYGRTPASTSDHPRAASPVTVIGTLTADAHALASLTDLDNIRVAKQPS